MNYTIKKILLVGVLAPCLVFAEDYLQDESQVVASPEPSVEVSGLSVEDQISSLSQQLINFQQQNYIERINEVQKEVQDLRGLVDMQSHQIQELQSKLSQKSKINTPATISTKSVKTSSDELNEYSSAFEYLKNRDYDKAVTLFNKFISEHTDGNYSPNAHYWLGEIYLLQGKYDLAEANLAQVIANYPEHSKVPDAMLKLAMVYVNTAKVSEAKALVSRLSEQYPKSTAARMANLQLGSL